MGAIMPIQIPPRKGLLVTRILQESPDVTAAEAAREAGSRGGYARKLRQRHEKAAAINEAKK